MKGLGLGAESGDGLEVQAMVQGIWFKMRVHVNKGVCVPSPSELPQQPESHPGLCGGAVF